MRLGGIWMRCKQRILCFPGKHAGSASELGKKFGIARMLGQRSLQICDGLSQVPSLQLGSAQAAFVIGGLEMGNGFRRVTLKKQCRAQHFLRARYAWVEENGSFEWSGRLRVLALRHVNRRQIDIADCEV